MKIPKVVWNPVAPSTPATEPIGGIQIPKLQWQPVTPPPEKEIAVKMPHAQWQPIQGLRDPIPIRVFSGVSGMDPYSLADTFASRIRNMSSSVYPALTVRGGSVKIGTSLPNGIQGLDSHKNSELHAVSNGNWYKWNGTSWILLLSGLNTSARWSFCNFKGNLAGINLIGTNGVDAPRRYDGTSITTLSGAPALGNFVDQHDNRLYMAVGNTLYVSALAKADDWSTAKDSQQIVVENQLGENIIGLKAGAGHVVVFLPSSIHELWGTGPKDYRMQIVAEGIGLMNDRCAVNINGILYFLGTNGIYRYGGGTIPSRDFSLAVEIYINAINSAAKDQCSAGTNGNNLYISFPSNGAILPDTILEYDPRFQGIWTVWKDFSPQAFTRVGNDLYMGDTIGQVFKMGSGTSDNGSAISWEWVSKVFSGSSLSQNVQWYRLWYTADIPSGSTMSVYLSKSAVGDSDWVLVKSLTSSDSQSGRITVPVDAIANAHYMRIRFVGTGPVTIHEIDRQQREIPLI